MATAAAPYAVVPIVAGVFLLHERPRATQWAGIALVIAGLVLLGLVSDAPPGVLRERSFDSRGGSRREHCQRVGFRSLVSLELVDRDGKSVGYVETVFKDRNTGRPEWLGVMTGTWRHHHRLVPASGVERSASMVVVPLTRTGRERAGIRDPTAPSPRTSSARLTGTTGSETSVA